MSNQIYSSIQDRYQKLSDVEHILRRPGYMMGSMVLEEKLISIMDFKSKSDYSITERDVSYVEGLERVYIEILSNAADNAKRSKTAGVPIGRIEVTVTRNTISIFNEGIPIPTEWHEKHQMWIPQMIFFNLRSGSNFDDTTSENVSGVNGVGSKISNIFSSYFHLKLIRLSKTS